MSDGDRLARIESKLDEMAQAVVALARVEERMAMIYSAHERHAERLQKIEGHLTKLDATARENGMTLRFAERLFWIVVTAGVGLVVFYVRGT